MVDAVSVIGTHLTEVVRRHAHELFTRQDAKTFCDRVAQENPKVIEDLVPKLLPLATIQRVIQNLLRERVPIRDAVGILEAMGEAAQTTKNPVLLTEYVRQSIRRGIIAAAGERAGRTAGLSAGSVDRARDGIDGGAWRMEQRRSRMAPETITRYSGAHRTKDRKDRIRRS